MAKRIKVRIGDVVSVPLPVGGFAYLWVLRDSTFAVFQLHSTTPLAMSEIAAASVAFYKSGTDEAIKSGEWPIVGHHPFESEEQQWGPPFATCYVPDDNSWTMGRPRISHKGSSRDATLDEVAGLEVLSVSHRPDLIVKSIVERLVNGDESNVKRVPKR